MKAWLLLICVLTGSVFLILPETPEPKDYFLLSDMKLHFATYVYFICERVVMIILAYVIESEVKTQREICSMFLLVQVGDLIDFLLCYNEVWFHVSGVLISYNVASCVAFGVSIVYFSKHD